MPPEINLKHGDFETTLSLEQLGVEFDTKSVVDSAYRIGREGNIFTDNYNVLSTMFNKVNLEPTLNLDEEQLATSLNEISAQLPDKVVESSYYVEGNSLVVTTGQELSLIHISFCKS